MEDWRFHLGTDENASAPAFDDAAWDRIALPHTWNAADGHDGGDHHRGDGWYRTRFRVPAPWSGKQLYVEFDGADRSAACNEGGTPGINDKGLVTYDRQTKKDAFFWYQANWSDRPVLHITSSRFVERTEPVTTVRVYSNAASVELFLNGVSLGVKSSSQRLFVWDAVQLRTGGNQVEVRAVLDGHQLVDRCSWSFTGRPQTGGRSSAL